MKKKIIILSSIIMLVIISIYTLYNLNFIQHKMYTNDGFNIKTYRSNVDIDKDGIDDQTDILNSVRTYISKNPKYKSKYYNTGYPNDKYGVCTDIVGFGLLGAGYDLMNLVNEDINRYPNLYSIKEIDKNIDFRRVRNLKIFFSNNAISLTTNLDEIEKWQGGDIIVFDNHIGIISDKRNKNGIPFIIHHASNYQKYYEEDILEKGHNIVGHYRIS